jgi:hypothetical protein
MKKIILILILIFLAYLFCQSELPHLLIELLKEVLEFSSKALEHIRI